MIFKKNPLKIITWVSVLAVLLVVVVDVFNGFKKSNLDKQIIKSDTVSEYSISRKDTIIYNIVSKDTIIYKFNYIEEDSVITNYDSLFLRDILVIRTYKDTVTFDMFNVAYTANVTGRLNHLNMNYFGYIPEIRTLEQKTVTNTITNYVAPKGLYLSGFVSPVDYGLGITRFNNKYFWGVNYGLNQRTFYINGGIKILNR